MNTDCIKQIIVIRKDLKMRAGKMAAQAAHASLKVLLDRMHIRKFASKDPNKFENTDIWFLMISESEPLYQWLRGSFTKIVVSVDNEKELLEIKQKAEDAGILCALITDAGKTEFHGELTNTALAVGPEWASKLDNITGDLKLL